MSLENRPSPFRTLLWKEWRESWWLLMLTLLGPTAWHAALKLFETTSNREGLEMLAPAGLCLLAVSLGAGLFAGERAQGTAAFLEERPAGRGTIWNAKIILPILALAAGGTAFGLLAFWLWPPERWCRGIPVDPCLFMAMACLFFASAVLCSVLLDRPVTAWAAGGVLCMALTMGEGYLFDRLIGLGGTWNNWRWPTFLGLLILEAIGLLLLSRILYVRWRRD